MMDDGNNRKEEGNGDDETGKVKIEILALSRTSKDRRRNDVW